LAILPGLEGPANLAEAYYQVSSMFSIIGDEQGSDQLLLETLKLVPDHAMALNNLGFRRIAAGHGDDDSVRWVERAYQLQPNDPNILDTVGWLRYKQGRFSAGQADPGKAEAGAMELIAFSLRAALVRRFGVPIHRPFMPPMPQINHRAPDAQGRVQYTVRMRSVDAQGVIVITDPLGRKLEGLFPA